MRIFEARNSNDMASQLYPALAREGIVENSRNGRVLRFREPVVTKYREPWHRANFTEGRDANPFFHIAEGCWMLAGREDVEFLAYFNKGMTQYSDDGVVFNAPYGHRLRRAFGHDQLEEIAHLLSQDPDSRQAVAQIWDNKDLSKYTLDKACNMILVFAVNDGYLQLTIYNRSNDAVYGAVTGANPVHMSMIQQWVADKVGLPMGNLYFVSNNMHVYLDLYPHWERMRYELSPIHGEPSAYHQMGTLQEFEGACNTIMYDYITDYDSQFMRFVAGPILNAWRARKIDEDPWVWLKKCEDYALLEACKEWIRRRK